MIEAAGVEVVSDAEFAILLWDRNQKIAAWIFLAFEFLFLRDLATSHTHDRFLCSLECRSGIPDARRVLKPDDD